MTQLPVPEPPHESRVWFITGASRGLGHAFAEAALAAGDRVVAAARDTSALDVLGRGHGGRLVPLPLDVSRRADVFAAVERATAAFGRLDVVVNNAGQLLFGMVEEATEEQARAHLDINFFGALWVTQAVLPVLRAQGSGHLFQVTAMGAGGGAAGTGLYGAGKAALAAVGEAVAAEVEPFGIHVTVLEPGGYDTGLGHLGTTATTPIRPTTAPVPPWRRPGPRTRPRPPRPRPPRSSWRSPARTARRAGSCSAIGRTTTWSRTNGTACTPTPIGNT